MTKLYKIDILKKAEECEVEECFGCGRAFIASSSSCFSDLCEVCEIELYEGWEIE